MEKLAEMLTWTGIEPDEGPDFGGNHGPYIQSQRMHLYKDSVEKLLQVMDIQKLIDFKIWFANFIIKI